MGFDDLSETSLGGGKYRLETLLGRGGMGRVYRAKQVELDRTVAIKIMGEAFLEMPRAVERFRREAHSASQLDHPNSVQILDFGSDGDLHYLVMEFLDGYHLGRYINRHGHFKLKHVVSVMAQVCAALAAAHDLRIIHRDIKPENVILLDGRDDRGKKCHVVKVCDFGFAKVVMGPSKRPKKGFDTLTQSGEVLGTPLFMSPEQAQGKDLGPRSDVYSCGVLLFEMVTGQLPFIGKTHPVIMMQHVLHPPPPPSSLNPDVSPELEALILRCLEKKPEARFAGMRELRAALLRLIGAKDAPSVKLELQHDFEGQIPDLTSSGVSDFTAMLSSAPRMGARLRSQTSLAARKQVRFWQVGAILGALLAFALGLATGITTSAEPGEGNPRDSQLVVSSAPSGARVIVNGHDAPTTTPTLTRVDADERFRLTVTLYGHKPSIEYLAVRDEALMRRHVELVPTAEAFVLVTCGACSVEVDGRALVSTAEAPQPVKSGEPVKITINGEPPVTHTLSPGDLLVL